MLNSTEHDQFGGDDNLGVGHVGNGHLGCRSIRHHALPGHYAVGVQADIQVKAGDLRLLSERRSTAGVFCQAVPFAHLFRGEGLPALRNLLEGSTAGKLGTRRSSGRETFQGKDATSANLASRNALCRPRKSPESNGRKRYHEV